MPEAPPTPTPAPLLPPAKQRRRRPWLRRALWAMLLLLLLVVGLIIAIQVALGTQLPRRIVLAQAQRELGLRMTAESVRTGWFGQTELRDVTLSLPLADQPFLELPRLDIRHNWLPALLLGAKLHIDAVSADQPSLLLRQEGNGRWNVQNLALGSGHAEQPQRADLPPRIDITNATVRIVDQQGREATIAPLSFHAAADDPVLWRFSGKVPGHISIDGDVAAGRDRAHRLHLVVDDVRQWLAPWAPPQLRSATAQARWRGRIVDGQLLGELVLEQARVDGHVLSGKTFVAASSDQVRLRPDGLRWQGPQLPPVVIQSGQLLLSDQAIEATDAHLSLAGGQAMLSARWDPASRSASLQAQWQDVQLPADAPLHHSGTLTASLQTPWTGTSHLRAELQSRGQGDVGNWQGSAIVSGSGTSLEDLSGQVELRQFTWRGGALDVAADGLVAQVARRGPMVAVNEIREKGTDRLRGNGGYDLSSGRFWLWLDARNLPVPRNEQFVFDSMLNVWGTPQQVHIEQFYARNHDLELTARGSLGRTDAHPVELDLYLCHPAPPRMNSPGDGPQANIAETSPSSPSPPPLFTGTLRSAAHISGTLAPLSLSISGQTLGDDLAMRGRRLGNVAGQLKGSLDAHSAKVRITDLRLLGGQWLAEASWALASGDAEQHSPPQIALAGQSVELGQLGQLFEQEGWRGTAEGRWTMQIPHLRLADLTGSGGLVATGVGIGHGGALEADEIRANAALRDGTLTVAPLLLQRGEGRAQAQLSLDLVTPAQQAPQQPQELHVQAGLSAWPMPLPLAREGARANVSGQATLTVFTDDATARGELDLSAAPILHQQPLGQVRIQATLDRRQDPGAPVRHQTIELRQLSGELLGAQVSGSAFIDAGDLRATRARLRWEQLDVGQLDDLWPQLGTFRGRVDGELVVRPADSSRALEPTQITLSLTTTDARFRALSIGDSSAVGYLGRDRFILDRGRLGIANGTVDLWGRLSRRPDEQMLSAQLGVDFQRLDLDQLVHTGEPDAEPMPGHLSGGFTLLGDPRHPANLTGQGTMHISDSDLVNFDPITFLYNAMNVATLGMGGGLRTSGTGDVAYRLENQTLSITSFQYFNRGVEVRGVGRIDEVWDLPDSPLSGVVVGSARPLRDIRLPLLADVDQALAALQSNITSVIVSGTVHDPRQRLALFGEIGSTMRNLLLGEVRNRKDDKPSP